MSTIVQLTKLFPTGLSAMHVYWNCILDKMYGRWKDWELEWEFTNKQGDKEARVIHVVME